MQIQINTDHHINGHKTMKAQVQSTVEIALKRFSDHITRVEIHVTDENGEKSGQSNKRCVMEARLERHQPLVVSHQAASVDQAVDGAVEKLKGMLDSTLGRMRVQKNRSTDLHLSQLKLTENS